MNRLAFVTNQKIKKIFSVVSTLKVGSVWKSVDSHLHTRITNYRGIEKGKYVFDAETCVYPRWFKRNQWAPLEMRVDEIYIKHDFPKKYQKVTFYEVGQIETGFKFKYIARHVALAGFMMGTLSICTQFLSSTPLTWWKISAWIFAPINLWLYLRASKTEAAFDRTFS